MTNPSGIAGLSGRRPVGAILTVGHKSPRGFPTDTDRFFIVVPFEEDGVRKQHPAFASFNGADVKYRQIMNGVLVAANVDGCFLHHLKAQVLPRGSQHPKKIPHCIGDGVTARRWMGGDAGNFKQIPCPHDRCEFRQRHGEKPPACKPSMTFYFQPVWKDSAQLPTPLMKFTSGAWSTTSIFKGFFDEVAEQASLLGVTQYHLIGLTFQLTLQRKTTDGKAFPVVHISPTINLQAFLLRQRQELRELGVTNPIGLLPGPEEDDPEVQAADYHGRNPGLGGGVVVDVGGDDGGLP